MDIPIPTTSAQKKAAMKGRRERERVKVTPPLRNPSTLPFADIAFYSSTAVRCAAHAHRAEETLEESAVSPHRPTHARCLDGGRCTTSGVNEGAERAHTCDWPARRCSSAATVYSA
jgi:hypothetical protein